MKKIVALILATVLVLSLVSCGESGDAPGSENSGSGIENAADSKRGDKLTDSEVASMYTNPGKYTDRGVDLTGRVFADPEYDGNDVYFQMWGDPENSENNTIVMYSGGDVELEDGDYVKLSGYIQGVFEGENMFGAAITCPQVVAETLEIVSYKDAVAPTIEEITLSEPTQAQYGYSVTVEKVELAEKETRVYIKVDNSGSDKFSLYSFNSVIIQNGKQFEQEDNYSADYPEVQTDLNVGVSTEGIFCFPAIESANFQIILEGSSDNFDETLEPFVFDVTI